MSVGMCVRCVELRVCVCVFWVRYRGAVVCVLCVCVCLVGYSGVCVCVWVGGIAVCK